MEKLGVLGSAERWTELAVLRNKVAHNYPNDPDKQVERLNAAFRRAEELIDVLDGVRTYVVRKRLADLADTVGEHDEPGSGR
ncbi:MAG: hypothetical protein ACT4P2_13645 [Pseudomonadota bacterium]